MATYVPAKKNTQFIFYIGLRSQADSTVMQSNPTIAAGDFKVSTDGGSLGNLGTLPAVTPASSKMVKITLSTSEMNGDNVTVVCSDASGAEWMDEVINIQTSARQIEDLAYPATSGRSMVVDANGLVDANTVKVGPTGSGTAQTARDIGASVLLSSGTGAGQVSLSSGTVTVGTNNDKTGYGLSAAAIQAIWDALTSALTTVGSVGKLLVDNINATISSRLATSGYTAPDNTSITAIKAKTDSLTFTKAGEVDANIQSVNDTTVNGNGAGTPWGP